MCTRRHLQVGASVGRRSPTERDLFADTVWPTCVLQSLLASKTILDYKIQVETKLKRLESEGDYPTSRTLSMLRLLPRETLFSGPASGNFAWTWQRRDCIRSRCDSFSRPAFHASDGFSTSAVSSAQVRIIVPSSRRKVSLIAGLVESKARGAGAASVMATKIVDTQSKRFTKKGKIYENKRQKKNKFLARGNILAEWRPDFRAILRGPSRRNAAAFIAPATLRARQLMGRIPTANATYLKRFFRANIQTKLHKIVKMYNKIYTLRLQKQI